MSSLLGRLSAILPVLIFPLVPLPGELLTEQIFACSVLFGLKVLLGQISALLAFLCSAPHGWLCLGP
jgi:hypothetical protein